MLLDKSEFQSFYYSNDKNEFKSYEQFIDYSEHYRVGYNCYSKPLSSYYSDSYKYTYYPKKLQFLNECLVGISNPKRNRKFRHFKPSEKENRILKFIVENTKPLLSYQYFEELIPLLETDVEILKRCNTKYSTKENIRSIFHIFYKHYPKFYFKKSEVNTIEEFLVG